MIQKPTPPATTPSRLKTSIPVAESDKNKKGSESKEEKPASKEEFKAVLTQIGIFLGTAVGLGLAFVFFILPLVINITGAAKMSEAPEIVEQTFIQAPILNAPPEYVNTPDIKITGFGQPNTNIQFIVNGNKNGRSDGAIGADGKFAMTLSLNEGNNTISAYTINKEGEESEATKRFNITLDQEIPEIEIFDLENDQKIVGKNNQTLVIKGRSEPKIKMYINGLVTQTNAEGEFSGRVQLQKGDNEIKFHAVDRAGNSADHNIRIKFEP